MIGRFAACVVVFSTTGLLTLSNYIASDIECLGIITGVGSGRLLQFLQMPNGKDDASNVLTIAKWIKQWAIDAPGKSFHKLLSTDHKTVGKSIFEAAYEFMLSMDDLRRQVPHNELIITALGTAALIGIIKRGLRRYRIATEVPQKYFRNGKRLSGYCVTVNDSDNLRFYHPRLFSFGKPDWKNETINVRLAGIDAPEMGHFGGVPQPYAEEAKQWLTKYTEGHRVTIQPHRLDHYSRMVATVWVRHWFLFWKNVSLEMVRAGYATVYVSAGAEYGGIKEMLQKAEIVAKKRKIGMWKQASTDYISPAIYKKQLKSSTIEKNLRIYQ